MQPTNTITPQPSAPVEEFIARWAASSGAERANKDSFLNEFCDVLGVPRPDPTTGDAETDRYCFEKDALTPHAGGKVSTGKIDLFKEGCFILEAKQGSEAGAAKLGTAKRGTPTWGVAMQAAYGQALGYSQTFDAPPPFLIVCDIGYCFDLYATFDGTRNYRDFPNAQHKRIYLKDLAEHLDTLRALFTAPHSLDPAKRTIKVTRAIAGHLAELARALEAQGHDNRTIASFLMRCIFTMFAEDAGLLPERTFTKFLEEAWLPNPARFKDEVEDLWQKMNTGGALVGVGKILRFNGGLFADPTALSLTGKQLKLLQDAAKSSWVDVEPAIFGTLLERALDPKERHALGAHFTPRAYVERLVRPTIEEPLRAEWDIVRAHVQQLLTDGDEKAAKKKAIAALQAFHRRLCGVSVLDPACGTGNFLYVTLDVLKRLESEVFQLLADLGETQTPLQVAGLTVTPAQFHGIEVKPWAKEIAELVLWIGYLQWLMRTRGDAGHIPEPVLQQYGNIECRDAVLAWDAIEPVIDDNGHPATRWDGESMKVSATGERVPDIAKRVPVSKYSYAREAPWPSADFIVGNPPYIGNKRMRSTLGDGYVEALRASFPHMPETADLVMYWWDKAARSVLSNNTFQFGLITTNSISQALNRKIVEPYLGPKRGGIVFAVPDHPWVDNTDGANVRVAMTVYRATVSAGILATVAEEVATETGEVLVTLKLVRGEIHPDLTVGANVTTVTPLRANEGLCQQGVKLVGPRDADGFVIQAVDRPSFGEDRGVIKRFISNKELVQKKQDRSVIDFSGLNEGAARNAHPEAYQRLYDQVRPFRAENRDRQRKRDWWLFGRSNEKMRESIRGLPRYIITPEVAKHRPFIFVDGDVIPDASLYVIGSGDAYVLGVLSSRVHETWALAAGGKMGVGNDPRYQSGPCFDPFPFPEVTDEQRARIRDAAERLDQHRRQRQAAHPELTITGLYNVLEKLRSDEELSAKERSIHEKGLVSILRQLHDELDAAVFDAYGWSSDLTDQDILSRLAALNADRASAEQKGVIRWLRSDFQDKRGIGSAVQTDLGGTTPADSPTGAADRDIPAWPKALPDRMSAVRDLLHARAEAVGVADVRTAFKRAPVKDVEAALETLASLGLVVRYDAPEGRRWKAATTASA